MRASRINVGSSRRTKRCYNEAAALLSSFSARLPVVAVVSVIVGAIKSAEAGRGYNYGDETTSEAYAPGRWDSVDSSDYDFDWKWLDGVIDYDGNDCNDGRQSPIDLEFDDDKCDEDDHRMISYSNGRCKWHEMDFKITPHELRMEMPMTDHRDPFNKGCRKPFLDMSGGFSNSFRAFMVHLKTPSEHRLNGVQYDAEIQILHIGEGSQADEIMYNGILVDASPTYPDNPILQPYLERWKETHDRNSQRCYSRFGYKPELDLNDPPTERPSLEPSISSAPSMKPSLRPTNSPTISSEPSPEPSQIPTAEPSLVPSQNPTANCEVKTIPTGFQGTTRDRNGVMFDVEVSSMPSNVALEIYGFDLNLDDPGPKTLQVYSRQGTHVGAESDPTLWTDIGVYTVDGKGKRNPSRLDLLEAVTLPEISGGRQAFYILDMDGSDVQTHRTSSSRHFDSPHKSDEDGMLTVYVGTAKDDHAFVDDDKPGEAFSGSLLYRACHRIERNGWPTLPTAVSPKIPRSAPTSAPCLVNALGSGWSNAVADAQEVRGLMFDIESNTRNDVVLIEAIDLPLLETTTQSIHIYVKEGSYTGFEFDQTIWTDFGEYSVKGMGRNATTTIVLDETIALPPTGERLALYIVQTSDHQIVTHGLKPGENTTDSQVSDQYIRIFAATGKESGRVSSDNIVGLAFAGNLHYKVCPHTSRRLDYLGKDKLTRFPYINIYRLHPSPWYFRYHGSLTMPPCSKVRHWRVFDIPMRISKAQLDIIHKMLRGYRDPDTCKLATQGVVDSLGRVSVARPLQRKSSKQDVQYCNSEVFGSSVKSIDFFETPRANTGWENLPDDPQYQAYHDSQGNLR